MADKADENVQTKGSAINLDDIKRFEVTEVYTHPDAKVDIVFVHGLNGDPRRSWTAKNGTFWPTQLLPTSLKSSQARILTYGYNADVWTFGSNKSPRHAATRFCPKCTSANTLKLGPDPPACTNSPYIPSSGTKE
jgi:hypothetical protein